MVMQWLWNKTKPALTPDKALAAVSPYVPPKELPPLRPGQKRCRHCSYGIQRYQAPGVEVWSTPMGEPPAPGVTLGNECPARPVPGFLMSFYRHEP